MSAGWGPSKSRQRSALASGVLASALLLSAAHAQVDRNWLDRALSQASDLSVPWDVLGRDAPSLATNLERPWPHLEGTDANDPRTPNTARSEKPSTSAHLSVSLVDALPYPWAEESRIQVKSELGDPWPREDNSPASPSAGAEANVPLANDQGAEPHADPLLSAEVFESGRETAAPVLTPHSKRTPWFAPTAELVDPWSDG